MQQVQEQRKLSAEKKRKAAEAAAAAALMPEQPKRPQKLVLTQEAEQDQKYHMSSTLTFEVCAAGR